MTPLPPWMFLAVGSIVVVVSLLLPDIIFFSIIGVIFLLVGVIKLVFAKRRGSEGSHTYHVNNVPPPNKHPPPPTASVNHKKCWVCGTLNPASAHYCFNCGHKLS